MAKGAYIGVDGVARKVKNGYIGVPTEVPVYDGVKDESFTLTNTNITDYFDVVNGTYGFTGDSSGKFSSGYTTSSAGRTSTSTWTAKYDITNMQMSYYSGGSPSTTANWDFTIVVNGVTKANPSKAGASATMSAFSLNAGESIVLTACVGSSPAYVNQITGTASVKNQVGTEILPVARKLMKAYIGIGDVAKLCWEADKFNYEKSETTYKVSLSTEAATGTSKTIYYSTDFAFNAQTGEFTLIDPSTVAVSYSKYTNASTLVGKYFIAGSSSDSAMWQASSSSSATRDSSSTGGVTFYKTYLSGCYKYTAVEL